MEWAFNQSKQGKVDMAAGRLLEARAQLQQSIDFFESLRPADDRSLAVSLTELAELELRREQTDEAIRLFERALPRLSKDDPLYGATLHAHALAYLAEALRRAGRQDESKPRLEEAMWLAQREVEGKPGDHHRKWAWSWVRLWNASLAVDLGRDADAESDYVAVETQARVLLAGEPSSKRFALVLAEALHGHEALARRGREPARVTPLYEERCGLVRQFLEMDAEDARFKVLACEGSGP